MKHAIMIMAHTNYESLKQLIQLLDSENIDIFVHINKLSRDWDDSKVDGITKHSKITLVNRVKITYCDYSQIQAVKSLLLNATKIGYDYYHIISGADLPLHSMKEFKDFFQKSPKKEYVNFCPHYNVANAGYRYFFSNSLRVASGGRKHAVLYRLNNFLLNLQRRLKVNFAKGYKGEIQKGADWWSITHPAAMYILEKEPEFHRYFRYTYCPSELLVQTILYNSPFRKNIYRINNDRMAALREIDWTRGAPYVWRRDDYEYLINSECMFARKFDEQVDKEIITKIVTYLQNK